MLAPLTVGSQIPDPECKRTWDNQPIPLHKRWLTVTKVLGDGLYGVTRPDGTYMVMRDSK